MPRTPSFLIRLAKWLFFFGLIGVFLVVGAGIYLFVTISPQLPPVSDLRHVQMSVPLRIYSADDDLIAEYGEKRREPVTIDQVPKDLTNAILAAEDKNFYKHPGVDWQGLLRAAIHLVKTGEKGPGGSTITMQVARNFFLSNERTYSRKLHEILLSLKIESELSKDEILELYINKVYLGKRAYGFAAGARVYYGKEIEELTLEEASMLAGLPKAPSRNNPLVNPDRAVGRRQYVLDRMLALGLVSLPDHARASAAPVTAEWHVATPEVEADYVGEMARSRLEAMFGEEWSTNGLHVYTTISSAAQRAANTALRNGLINYELRHGFKGPVGRLDPETLLDPVQLDDALAEYPAYGGLQYAVVTAVTAQSASVVLEGGAQHTLTLDQVAWARQRVGVDTLGDEVERVSDVLSAGDVISVRVTGQDVVEGSDNSSDQNTVQVPEPQSDNPQDSPVGVFELALVQEPEVEGALVAMDPRTGAIRALVGGFDFHRNKFNRAVQARRQPGSTFKPFIYSAALEAGNTAATIYNDAPVVFHDSALEGEWRPSNYSGKFFGPTRLREALVKSRNLVSIRVLREIGIEYAIDHASRFGFDREHMPADLSLALGSAGTSPLEVASAFSVFANGGYRVVPHFIARIEDADGRRLYEAPQVGVCSNCDAPPLNRIDRTRLSPEEVEHARREIEGYDEQLDKLGEHLFVELSESLPEPSAGAPETVVLPRVVEARNAYIMNSLMRDVVRRGTARKAGEHFDRKDLAGKTGTTNNQLDGWFTGFNERLVASVWVGNDGLEPLGRKEAGGVLALPIWVEFMDDIIATIPETLPEEPRGIVTVRIDSRTAEPVSGAENGVNEIFRERYAPGINIVARDDSVSAGTAARPVQPESRREQRRKKKEVEQLF